MDEDLFTEIEEANAAVAAAGGDKLERLKSMASTVLSLDEDIARTDRALSALKSRRYDIVTKDMIALMDEVGVEFFSVDGRLFNAVENFHASIKEENRDAAHDLLERNEAGDLIKYVVSATFGKDSESQVRELSTYIRQRYQDAQIDVSRSVPWKRLTSWFKEQVMRLRALPPDADDGLPKFPVNAMDVLGAKMERVVEVKEPKDSKPRAPRRRK